MSGRTAGVVLAAAAAGLLFAPVFGLAALLVPVGAPAAAVLLVALLCTRPAAVDWRPVLTLLAGLLTVVLTLLRPTTTALLPTTETARALAAGVTDSWRLVLQSTWPARPDAELMLFVPLLVLLAAVLGVEILHRLAAPAAALLPSLAVVALSQLYAALDPVPAVAAALAYAAVGGLVLRTGPWRRAGPPAAVAVAAAVAAGVLLPAGPPRHTLARQQPAPVPAAALTNPLDEVAGRLADPFQPVFRVAGATDVDRWPVVVLTEFDGVTWAPAERFRRLGSRVPPGPGVTVPARRRTAEIRLAAGQGPWLPSQTWPARVEGTGPLVAEDEGTLLLPVAPGAVTYRLSWWQPQTAADALAAAAIDPAAPGGFGEVGVMPAEVQALATRAVRGNRASFATALALETWFRENYRIAIGRQIPAGHGWPQLTPFLLETRRGTSEQFASAYVALARFLGIPARLAVGYRMPVQADADGLVTVRNGEVLVWPEVAVRGVGWVPLDPTGGASASGATTGLAGLAERARQSLPPPEELGDPPVAAAAPDAVGERPGMPWPALLALPLLPLVGWPVGVPLLWAVRSRRRRRRPGTAAVAGAWEEVRDRLRAHGAVVSAGMTVRDLAAAAATVADPPTVAQIHRLSAIVDRALWSGEGAGAELTGEAWAAVRSVRQGLARGGPRRRLRALLDPRPLRSPR